MRRTYRCNAPSRRSRQRPRKSSHWGRGGASRLGLLVPGSGEAALPKAGGGDGNALGGAELRGGHAGGGEAGESLGPAKAYGVGERGC